jgi:transcriptional regulator with XRE-family HTH domain
MPVNSFGDYLKQRRECHDLSLSCAAKLVGCTKTHLWELEQDRSQNPTIKVLLGLSRAYKTDLGLLANLAASHHHAALSATQRE